MITRHGIKLSFRKVDEGYYEVLFNGQVLGCLFRDPDAWSYASWFVEGDRHEYQWGGVNNRTRKRSGFALREFAAERVAMTQSIRIIELSKP